MLEASRISSAISSPPRHASSHNTRKQDSFFDARGHTTLVPKPCFIRSQFPNMLSGWVQVGVLANWHAALLACWCKYEACNLQRSLWLPPFSTRAREAFLYAGGNQNASRTLEGSAPNHLLSTDKCRVQQLESTFVGTPPYPSSPAPRCKRPLGPRSIGPCLVPPPGKLDPGVPAYSNMASRNRFAPKLRSFTLLISISASLSNETPLSRKLVQAHLGKKTATHPHKKCLRAIRHRATEQVQAPHAKPATQPVGCLPRSLCW